MATWASQRTGNWARTSDNADSPWHDGGAQTALATVPGASGTDSVTITATHTVTYNYDMSAAGVLSALVLNGTLVASTSAGAYYLKMGGTAGQNITFGAAGSLQAGSSGTAYPANCTFAIDLNGSSGIDLASGPSGCLALYCTEPTWNMVRIGAEAAGQTQLDITGWRKSSDGTIQTGQDLTTDASWASPRTVYVAHVRVAGYDIETRVIASTAAASVTVTAGLTGLKASGSWVVLSWRNVRIIGYNTTAGAVRNGTGAILNCEIALGSSGYGTLAGTSYVIGAGCIHGGSRGISAGTTHAVDGSAVFALCTSAIYAGTRHTVQGYAAFVGCTVGYNMGGSPTVQGSALFTGCGTAYNGGTNATFQGSVSIVGCTRGSYVGVGNVWQGNVTITGCEEGLNGGFCHVVRGSVVISGCTYGVRQAMSWIFEESVTITGCTYGINESACELRGTVLNNTNDLYTSTGSVSNIRGWNVTLAGGTQNSGYRSCPQSGAFHSVIWDIAGVEGAVKAWTYGGKVVSVATQPTNWPASPAFVQSYEYTFESALGPVFLDKPIYAKADELITIDVYCKMSASGMTTRGTFVLIDPDQPLPIPTVTLDSEVMADDTSWQKLTLTYTPTYDRELTLRGYGVNGSGTLIWREVVTFGTGGGGGATVIGSPIIRGGAA